MKYLQSILLLLFPFFLIAQSSSAAVNALIDDTDVQLGTNDALVNGRPFVQKNIKSKGSPFFLSELVNTGIVFTNDKKFEQQTLRYNLETDALILSTTLQNGVPFEIVLNDNIIDSFSIGQHFFVSKQNIPAFKDNKGYAERIYKGAFTFYRLQKVSFLSQFSEKYPNGKYTEPQVSYSVLLSGKEIGVSSLKDFAALFPSQKKKIIRFAKKEKIRFKKASLPELMRLMSFVK